MVVPWPWRAMKPLTAAWSCGLPLRIAQAISPPVRKVISSCTVIFGKTFFQKTALCLSTTIKGIIPALSISIRSSSSKASGASLRITAGLFSLTKR
ncbi:hypothetical protein D3C81_808100 [compost metagenome]